MSIDRRIEPSQPELRVTEVRAARDLLWCLRIRLLVFVREQRVPIAEEIDEADATALHLLARLGSTPVGTARLVDVGGGTAKIGRVAVLPEYRGRGVGSALMDALLNGPAAGYERLVLDAQVYVQGFYTRWGFAVVSGEFMDAGIPHVRMERIRAAANTARRPAGRPAQ